jgi:Na+/glutamate symporter
LLSLRLEVWELERLEGLLLLVMHAMVFVCCLFVTVVSYKSIVDVWMPFCHGGGFGRRCLGAMVVHICRHSARTTPSRISVEIAPKVRPSQGHP